MKETIKVKVIRNFTFPDKKIVSIQFPPGVTPKIGANLLGNDNKLLKIIGIVFDVHIGSDIWDCLIEDKDGIAEEGMFFSVL